MRHVSVSSGRARQTGGLLLGSLLALSVAGCNSSDDDGDTDEPVNPDMMMPGGTDMPGGPDNPDMSGGGTFSTLALADENGPPNGNLDGLEADLDSLFGDANGTPFAVGENDTLTTIVGARSQAQ